MDAQYVLTQYTYIQICIINIHFSYIYSPYI